MLRTEADYIGGIQRFSTEDGPGIRTTVFVKGCPLHCAWCHNPELIDYKFRLMYRKKNCIGCGQCVKRCPQKALTLDAVQGIVIERQKCIQCGACVERCCTQALYTKSGKYTVDELMQEIMKDQDFYRNSNGGVTLSGGEILSHPELAGKIADQCLQRGISVVLDTSGYGAYSDLEILAGKCDWILYDLKHMDRERHKELTGVYPDRIWENLEHLCERTELRRKIIIRVPYIHGVNDGEDNLKKLRSFMVDHQLSTINFLPYHKMGISKARDLGIMQTEFETPSDAWLQYTKAYFGEENLQVTIMGYEN